MLQRLEEAPTTRPGNTTSKRALLLGCLVALTTMAARAEEPVRLEYQAAAATCPTREELVRRIEERWTAGRFAGTDEFALRLKVTASIREDGALAELLLVDESGDFIQRRVIGHDCEEAITAIALVAALAVDARAERSRKAASEPPFPSAFAPAASPRTQPAHLPPPPPHQPDKPQPILRSHGRSGFGAAVNGWMGPTTSLGYFAFLGFDAPRGQSLRLSAFRWRSSNDVDQREASAMAWLMRLDGCPVALSPSERVHLSPCLAAELGRFEAWGIQSDSLPITHQEAMTWSSVLAMARLSIDVISLLSVELQGEMGLPVTRQKFVFDLPRRTVLQIPRFGVGAQAGVSLRFP